MSWLLVDWSLMDLDSPPKKVEAANPASATPEEQPKRKRGRPRKVIVDADPR